MNWKHFSIKEFECPCCGDAAMDYNFIDDLDKLRELLGRPLNVTSGYRCSSYNKSIGGKRNSAHVRGLAADIRCRENKKRWQIIELIMDTGLFYRVGVYDKHIHVDQGLGAIYPNKVLWVDKSK